MVFRAKRRNDTLKMIACAILIVSFTNIIYGMHHIKELEKFVRIEFVRPPFLPSSAATADAKHISTWVHNYTSGSGLFPSKINSFDDLLELEPNLEVPTNLHLIFAGDSLSRYQYLSLSHFLKYGKFVDPDAVPNMMKEKDFGTWLDFFRETNKILQPEEQCDCFRPEGHKMSLMMENRYFMDKKLNNSVSFVQKFGHKFTFKSNWNYADVHEKHDFITTEKENDYVIETMDWAQFISDFVANLEPKPLYFIFNEGIHPHKDFSSRKIRRQIIRAIKENGMISVYKTTTKYRDHGIEVNGIIEDEAVRDYERDFCERADFCLDLSWTWMVPPSFYSDYAHFVAPVYTWQNLQLFDVLNNNFNQVGNTAIKR